MPRILNLPLFKPTTLKLAMLKLITLKLATLKLATLTLKVKKKLFKLLKKAFVSVWHYKH